MKQPCRQDCPRRTATCHGACPEWAAWEEFKRQEYARRSRENVIKDYMCALSAKLKHKNHRRTR